MAKTTTTPETTTTTEENTVTETPKTTTRTRGARGAKATTPTPETTPETTPADEATTTENNTEDQTMTETTTTTDAAAGLGLVWEEPAVIAKPKKQTRMEQVAEALKGRPDTFAKVESGLKYRNKASEWRKNEDLVVECTPDPETGLFNIYAKHNPEEAAKLRQEKADKKAANAAKKAKAKTDA